MKKVVTLFFSTAIFLVACNVKTTPATPADTALDKNFFEQATSSSNLKQCDAILDKNLKQQCQDVINSSKLTLQATESLDPGICSKIAISRAKTYCIDQVNIKLESKNADKNRIEISQKAMTANDENICNQIADENQKASCRYNIIANKAIQKKDSSLCSKIGNKEMEEECSNFTQK